MTTHSAHLLRRLNPYCAQALAGAATLCQTRAHAEITVEHWLLKLLEQGEGDITVIARRMSGTWTACGRDYCPIWTPCRARYRANLSCPPRYSN